MICKCVSVQGCSCFYQNTNSSSSYIFSERIIESYWYVSWFYTEGADVVLTA